MLSLERIILFLWLNYLFRFYFLSGPTLTKFCHIINLAYPDSPIVDIRPRASSKYNASQYLAGVYSLALFRARCVSSF